MLAGERTELAWVRTGLTALAVAVGVGQIAPELGDTTDKWPYAVLGIGFAVYGILLITWGALRGRSVENAVRAGRFAFAPEWASVGLAVAGIVLGIGTIVVIAVA